MDPAHDPALAFATRWAAAMPVVAGYLRSLIADRHDRDDLVQEVAAAAYAGSASYDPTRPFTTWVLGIAHHKALNWLRSRGRARVLTTDPALLTELAQLHQAEDEAFSHEREALQDCLRGLPERSWNVVRLHYHDGLAPLALAARLGLTAVHVRQLLHRIRCALRTCIERRMESSRG